jgi:hypothetical protein
MRARARARVCTCVRLGTRVQAYPMARARPLASASLNLFN